MWRLILLSLVVLGFTQSTVLAQTRLERIYQNMHPAPRWRPPEPPAPPANPNRQQSEWLPENHEDDLETTAYFGLLGLIGATSPFWVPSYFFDEGTLAFTKYPYARDLGCMNCEYPSDRDTPTPADYWENARLLKGWTMRASLDTGNNFDGLHRVGGQLFLDTNFYRLGVLANVNWYREQNPFGDDPNALMTDLNVTYRVTQSRWLLMHVGAGARMWNSLDDLSGGVNAFYRADVYPIKPLNLSLVGEVGNLDQSLYLHLRSQIGFNWRHGELFIGYDWTRVANVTLQGPLIGLRLWF